jgi:hypothetical protein
MDTTGGRFNAGGEKSLRRKLGRPRRSLDESEKRYCCEMINRCVNELMDFTNVFQDGARPALTDFPFYVLFFYLCIMRTVCV